MKKIFILGLAIMLCCNFSFAKIWRVNNNAGTVSDFTTAQAANDNAGVIPGDTVNLEPSLTSYGQVSIYKRLIWISTGAFLSIHPSEQFLPNSAMIGQIFLYPGSENSVLLGLYATSITIYCAGIRIDRCFSDYVSIGSPSYTSTNNFFITNCYLSASLGANTSLRILYGNGVVTNNIMEREITIQNDNVTSVIISHNVINAGGATGSTTIYNSQVEDNIFNKPNQTTFYNCTVQYNMSGVAGVLPFGNNNQNGVDMSTVFINNNGTDDASFVLKAGSPAIGAGSGTPPGDMGAFGGTTPYRLALQAPIPAIYKIQSPIAPSGNTLNIIFSTKSNN